MFIFFLKPVMSGAWDYFYEYFGFSVFFFGFVFYAEFERVLLSSRYTIPEWDRYFILKKYAVLAFSISFPIVYKFFGEEILSLEVFFFSSGLSLFVVRTYFVISKIKERSVHFFIFGSASFLLLANIGSYFNIAFRNRLDTINFDPLLFVYIGVMIEALVFTNIMGKIFKQILEKKSNLKVQYALKQKETAELKMTALQSQMNPHFLFNCLNSINNFILKNEKEEASDYITSFSKLVRKILKNSESLEISLFEELEVLEMYVSLEKTRLPGGFSFIKEIDESLNLHEIMVPPLFLQPFIENSIWHGLASKVGEKEIVISIKKEAFDLVISVEDNGIGIDSEVMEQNRVSSKRKFFGSYATEKRIKLMHPKNSVKISTSNISSNTDSGTRVAIVFPLS